jgi:uncharacterized RDD family membrane protein YckC
MSKYEQEVSINLNTSINNEPETPIGQPEAIDHESKLLRVKSTRMLLDNLMDMILVCNVVYVIALVLFYLDSTKSGLLSFIRGYFLMNAIGYVYLALK